MKVIPVVDLMRGQVVLGRAGQRHTYQPIAESVICNEPTMDAILNGLESRLGLRQVYVADLDAIQGKRVDWNPLRMACDRGFQLWLDNGVRDITHVTSIFENLGQGVSVVVGLETVESPSVLAEAVEHFGESRIVVSLDLVNGSPLASVARWKTAPAADVAAEIIQHCGIRRMILLDLRRVGTGRGPGTESLLARLRTFAMPLELVCGGGFSDLEELNDFNQRGADAVLLATMLHRGTIGRSEIEQLASR